MSNASVSPKYVSVSIPTNQSFLKQWNPWVQHQVSKRFKRDKERAWDTAQDVRVRLLAKNFIGRWFYKHLKHEMVDTIQACRILGGMSVPNITSISPVVGKRSQPDALWLVSDILAFAKFDYERYFYSIQDHTLDSGKILRLLGYGPTEFGILESLYRQGRIRPSELTEHQCYERVNTLISTDGKCAIPGCDRKHYSRGFCSSHYKNARTHRCTDCDRGRESLRKRGLSLAQRWTDPETAVEAAKLRWNDTQLKPFLREWRKMNMIRTTPEYVMRHEKNPGIDAGLLKYAKIVIDNEVVNSFKRVTRTDDLSIMVLNDGKSPEFDNSDTIAWESDDASQDTVQQVVRDRHALRGFSAVEHRMDTEAMFGRAGLTEDESQILASTEDQDVSVREVAQLVGKTTAQVHRVRTSALKKMRVAESESLATQVAARHGVEVSDMLSIGVQFGRGVVARADFFATLSDMGHTPAEISRIFGFSEERVVSAINRACIRESRTSPMQVAAE